MNRTVLLLAGAALFAACSSTPSFQAGPDAEVTFDGLTRMEGTVLDTVWARTDIDVRGADKVMFEGLGVEFRPVSGPYSGRAGTGSLSTTRTSQTAFPMDAATQARFTEEIRGVFLEEIARSNAFELVEEPGPGVLKLRVGLYDVVSRIPPETAGRSNIFVESVGEATLVLELRDSESNAILIRAIDRRAAERSGGMMTQSTRATNLAEVRRLGRRWAAIIRDGLDGLLTEGVQAAN